MNAEQLDTFYKLIGWLIVVNVGTLVTLVITGVKVVTAFNEIKFKVSEMWKDYEFRSTQYRRRVTDVSGREIEEP